MSLDELFYFVIGLIVIYMVYWQVFNVNEESHKLLINYGEAVGMVYGEEEDE